MRPSVVLFLLVLGVAGCCRHALVDETQKFPYAGLLRQGAVLRRTSLRVVASRTDEEPLRLAIEHVRAVREPASRVLVLVSGVFSSRATWRFLVGPLGQHHDLLLLDPPGTGASDKPAPHAAGRKTYTPEWLARHEMAAVERWSRTHDDRRPVTLVGHSLGAAAILRMLSDPELAVHAPELMRRVDRIVLISPPSLVVAPPPPTLRKMAEITQVEIGFARFVGLLGPLVEDGLWDSQYDPVRSALRADAEALKQSIVSCETRVASQTMLRRHNPTRWDGTLDTGRVARTRRNLTRVAVPVLILCGEEDDTLPPTCGRELASLLPWARLRIVPHARHSPHIERAPLVAEIIHRFVQVSPGRAAATAGMRSPPVRRIGQLPPDRVRHVDEPVGVDR